MDNNDASYVSSVDYACTALREKILSGELKQGTRLSKRKTAELLGTSVSPVVVALYKLEEDGLVENKERWGSRVAVVNELCIYDLYMLRMAVECQIVRILAEKMTKSEYQKCLAIANKLDDSKYASTELDEISSVHLEFHNRLAKIAGCPSLAQALERCNLKWILCNADEKVKELRELPEQWHKRILDAIMTRDEDFAEKVMREHIYDYFKDIL